MQLHSFQDSLAKSHAQAEAPWWFDVYRQAFPGFVSMMNVRKDGWAQRGGIDRVVQLSSGRTVTVDEKVREKDWGDILLERWSDRDRQVPGWIQKDLACDYIAYAFVPSERCYLFPFLDLRRAWLSHGRRWCALAQNDRDGFRIVDAQNRGYVTQSIAIPTSDLFASLKDGMCVSWGAPTDLAERIED